MLEGHAVHDREGRRLRRRRARDRGRAHRYRRRRRRALAALRREMVLLATPTPMSRVLLARPRGARAGHAGASACSPCRGGSRTARRNSYRIVRLKDKLGTRSMASGEIILEGAVAYLVGDVEQRLQADDGAGEPVAAQPRRARGRDDAPLPQRGAGGGAQSRAPSARAIGEYPLLRRQLMKIMLPTEQALSMYAFSADAMGQRQRRRQGGGEPAAHPDAGLQVPRLPRQHPGRHQRARGARRQRLHRGMGERPPGARRADRHAVGGHLQHQRARRGAARRRQGGRPQGADGGAEGQVRTLRRAARPVQGPARRHPRSRGTLRRGGRRRSAQEKRCRLAAGALYHATTAALLAWEGATLGAKGGDARRLCCRGW